MFIDARSLGEGDVHRYDLCIVGAGAAGISIAREFIGRRESVCLLESGGLDFDPDTQALAAGDDVGQPYFSLVSNHLRYFGGTTNHWAGNCFPLSEIVMKPRDWLDQPSWPLDLEQMNPYYERAYRLIGLPDRPWDLSHWLARTDARLLPLMPGALEPVPVQVKPQRFGQVYRDELKQAVNVDVHHWANLTEFETDPEGHSVRRAHLQCLSGRTYAVEANRFVLAAGGVENARLLLVSNRVQPAGLGNRHDQVGRYFQDHPRLIAGELHPQVNERPGRAFGSLKDGDVRVSVQYRVAPAIQAERRIMQSAVALKPVPPDWVTNPSEELSVMSYRHILRQFKRARMPEEFGNHLANVFSDLGAVTRYAYGELRYGDEPPVDHYRCWVRFEPVPNPDSRITLSDKTDALGMRRPRVRWALADEDRHTVRETMRLLAAEAGRSGYGRVRSFVEEEDWAWPADTFGGRHEMGTTRISEDPRRGVVDKNCRVHGLSNLYVAGSSVFPTSGSGWPTMTLIAMALRLADHLKSTDSGAAIG